MTQSHLIDHWRPWRDVALEIAGSGDAWSWPADGQQWLTPREQGELAAFRAPRRRREWLAGRWLSKRLLAGAEATVASLRRWEIVSRLSLTRGCRPVVLRDNLAQDFSLSLAHDDTAIAAAVGEPSAGRVGVDFVPRQALPAGFGAVWFSANERDCLAQHGWSLADGWAAKEASFKAVNNGESFRPRRFSIARITGDECVVEYELPCGQVAEISNRLQQRPDVSIACARHTPP